MNFKPRVKIRMIKEVNISPSRKYAVGDILEASYDTGHYWVGAYLIYKDEAVLVDDFIDERFIQLGEN